MNELMETQGKQTVLDACGSPKLWNPTVEENLDLRIKNLEDELARAKQSKIDLEPLLKMRIRDIRDAMNF